MLRAYKTGTRRNPWVRSAANKYSKFSAEYKFSGTNQRKNSEKQTTNETELEQYKEIRSNRNFYQTFRRELLLTQKKSSIKTSKESIYSLRKPNPFIQFNNSAKIHHILILQAVYPSAFAKS